MYPFSHYLAFIALLTITIKAQQYFSQSDDYAETDSELVSVEHSIHRRSLPEIVINVTIRGIKREFILQSSDGYFAGKDTKVWIAKNEGGKLKYTLQENVMEDVNITFYLDVKTKSSIAHTVNRDGISEFNGVIDSDKIIRSLNNHDRKRRDVSSKLQYESSVNDSKNYHLLHKRHAFLSDHNNYYQTDDTNNYQQGQTNSINTPKIVYPELLVYVDKTLFEYHKKDIVKTVAYVLTIFNGADLYFRDMDDPSIRLSIAGIVLCEDLINTETLNGITINQDVVFSFGKFLYSDNQFKVKIDYDIAVYLLNPRKRSHIRGMSYTGQVCEKSVMREMVKSLTIISDIGILDGIRIAAHEIGHVLGTKEDNYSVPECSYMNGFVMSYDLYDQNQFFFSSCSKEKIKWNLSKEEARCVLNNPANKRTDSQILRVLPGQYMAVDEQCQKRGYWNASSVNEDICLQLHCLHSPFSLYVESPALEGTPCDFGKYCLRGDCVNVPFNNSDKNADLNNLFPFKYQQRESKETAEQQCEKYYYKFPIKSFFDVCQLICVFKNNFYFYMKERIADDGSPCSNNGICQRGRCIDDTYRLANDYCRKAGTTGFSNYSAKECTINCKIETYKIPSNGHVTYEDKLTIIKKLVAPNRHPCSNSGYCQDGKCINKTFSTGIIDPSTSVDGRYGQFASSVKMCKQKGMKWMEDHESRCFTVCQSNTGMTKYLYADRGLPCPNNGYCDHGRCIEKELESTTTALDILHPKFKSSTERCQDIGYSWSYDYSNGCISVCQIISYSVNKPRVQYLNADNGLPCNNSGYCDDGQCINMTGITRSSIVTTTSTVGITDSTTPMNKLPINLKSPADQCTNAGFISFVSLDKFDCTVVCSNATDIDYYEYEDYENEDSETNIYQDISRPDGIPCKYHGHCLSGECVGMSLRDPKDKSTMWDFDALKIFQNNTRRVMKPNGGENDSNAVNNGENKKLHVSVDFSDIDDDVKEFAKNIKIFL